MNRRLPYLQECTVPIDCMLKSKLMIYKVLQNPLSTYISNLPFPPLPTTHTTLHQASYHSMKILQLFIITSFYACCSFLLKHTFLLGKLLLSFQVLAQIFTLDIKLFLIFQAKGNVPLSV